MANAARNAINRILNMMKKPHFKPLGGAVTAMLDPLLAKRTHVDASLALSWPELAGEKLAGRTQPLKVTWPRRGSPDDPFEPGTLAIACEGSAALDLQYQSGELVARINGLDRNRPTPRSGMAQPAPITNAVLDAPLRMNLSATVSA